MLFDLIVVLSGVLASHDTVWYRIECKEALLSFVRGDAFALHSHDEIVQNLLVFLELPHFAQNVSFQISNFNGGA